jgi:APA family basic amino acid/polyamine antiporter
MALKIKMEVLKENLKREIGARSLALAIVNVVVGSGIFVIPAVIAEGLGGAAILAYFVCGAIILSIGLCFAEAGSKTKVSGGVYTYIETAFGPYAGFLANNLNLWGGCVTDAAIATALATTMEYFFPILSEELPRIIFLFLVFGILTLINIRSVKSGLLFVRVTAFGKLLPLVLLIGSAIFFVDTENLKWTISPTFSNVGYASLLLFFAFQGMEVPMSNGGEMKNPGKTVPLGILMGVFAILVLYIGIQLVTQGVLGQNIAQHKNAPLAAVAGIAFGKSGAVLVIVITAISMLGSLGGEILSNPRGLFAGARDGLMPKTFAKVHPRYFTPYNAIAAYSAVGFLCAAFGGFRQLAVISSASVLTLYLGVVLATVRLRRKDTPTAEKTFRIPGGIIIPFLASAGITWLLSSLTFTEIVGLAIFIAFFSVIYAIMNALKKNPDNDKESGSA